VFGTMKKFRLPLFSLTVFLLPLALSNNYLLMTMNIAALNVLIVTGLNLLMGYAGQISLGHAAFFGIGAYLSAILTMTFHVPVWSAMLTAMIATAGIAAAIGIPALRLEGHYLVMATLGFNVIVYIITMQFSAVTGGPSGLAGIPHLCIPGFVFDSDIKTYYLFWCITIGTLTLSLNLVHSRTGRAMAALSHNEIAARCAGIDTEFYKIRIFVISAITASLAGSLYASYISFISPGTFSIFFSIQMVTMVMVGGMGSLWGSALGAVFLTLLPECLHGIKEYNALVYGGILLCVLMFFPKGLFPGIAAAFRKQL
jgi:branched-chain amino acid transport system permease protein